MTEKQPRNIRPDQRESGVKEARPTGVAMRGGFMAPRPELTPDGAANLAEKARRLERHQS